MPRRDFLAALAHLTALTAISTPARSIRTTRTPCAWTGTGISLAACRGSRTTHSPSCSIAGTARIEALQASRDPWRRVQFAVMLQL